MLWQSKQQVESLERELVCEREGATARGRLSLSVESPLEKFRVRRVVKGEWVVRRKRTRLVLAFPRNIATRSQARVELSFVRSTDRKSGKESHSVELEIEYNPSICAQQGADLLVSRTLSFVADALCRHMWRPVPRNREKAATPRTSGPRTSGPRTSGPRTATKAGPLAGWNPVSSPGLDMILGDAVKGVRPPKPHTLVRSDLEKEGRPEYAVTTKLDGARAQLLVSEDGRSWVLSGGAWYSRSEGKPGRTMSVLDGEMFRGVFWAFDVAKGPRGIASEPLHKRLAFVSSSARRAGVRAKRFFTEGSEATRLSDARTYASKMEQESGLVHDGFVLTPVTGGYRSLSLKYKPPSMQTIDFQVVRSSSECWDLYLQDKGVLVLPREPEYSFGCTSLVIQDELWVKAGLDPAAVNGSVVEFRYEVAMGWLPLRARGDKKMGNSVSAAANVWQAIMDGMTPEGLLQVLEKTAGSVKREALLEWNKFHNKKKLELLLNAAKELHHLEGDVSVLDLGVGRGGDLMKYEKMGVSRVLGVDPSSENLEELKSRLARMKPGFGSKVELFQGTAEDTRAVLGALGRKVDLVVAMFSLTFFFEDASKLDALADTIAGALEDGGLFVGVTMDGSLVDARFEAESGKPAVITAGPMRLTRENTLSDGRARLGQEIRVSFPDRPQAILQEQDEWLVFEPILTAALALRGVVLKSWRPFEGTSSSSAPDLSSLQSSFVYTKIHRPEAGDEVQGKLLDLLDTQGSTIWPEVASSSYALQLLAAKEVMSQMEQVLSSRSLLGKMFPVVSDLDLSRVMRWSRSGELSSRFLHLALERDTWQASRPTPEQVWRKRADMVSHYVQTAISVGKDNARMRFVASVVSGEARSEVVEAAYSAALGVAPVAKEPEEPQE
jgi:hypothetical protein